MKRTLRSRHYGFVTFGASKNQAPYFLAFGAPSMVHRHGLGVLTTMLLGNPLSSSAATTLGSKCVPDERRTSAMTSLCVCAERYGLLCERASTQSASATMRA